MAKIRFLQVDAFTNRPFGGNPAAVCLLEDARDESWMQAVAAEMNLSETAFLLRRNGEYDLRWFTPKTEIELCGHATLASAHALWTLGRVASDQPVSFRTRSGVLVCSRHGDFIEMDFPATPIRRAAAPAELALALGVEPVFFGQSRFDQLVVVNSEADVRALEPDFSSLTRIAERGVIVTSISDDAGFDFVSRFFAPAVGIDEDPVTGSAHCCLGPYWSERLGKTELTAFQASSRGGIVTVRVRGDRVALGGKAITVLEGHLLDT